MTKLGNASLFHGIIQNDEVVYADFNLMGAIHVFVFRVTLASQVSREKQDPKVNL